MLHSLGGCIWCATWRSWFQTIEPLELDAHIGEYLGKLLECLHYTRGLVQRIESGHPSHQPEGRNPTIELVCATYRWQGTRNQNQEMRDIARSFDWGWKCFPPMTKENLWESFDLVKVGCQEARYVACKPSGWVIHMRTKAGWKGGLLE